MKKQSKPLGSLVKSKRGRPPRISREDIISASLRAKTELTLKSVADDLRVTPQALYRYVSGLGDIMEMVTEKLAEEYPFPGDEGQDWFEWAYEGAHILRRFYEAIPGLAEYAMNTPWQVPVVLARYELSLTIAKRTGFDEGKSYWATCAFVEFVYTWVAREQRRAAMTAEQGRTDLALLIETTGKSATKYPLLNAALRKVSKTSTDDRFDFTLRWLLTGMAHETGLKIALPPKASVAARRMRKAARPSKKR